MTTVYEAECWVQEPEGNSETLGHVCADTPTAAATRVTRSKTELGDENGEIGSFVGNTELLAEMPGPGG